MMNFNTRKQQKAEQKRLESEMSYRRMTHNFERYTRSLEQLIAQYKRKAYDASCAGRKDLALRNAQFVNTLTNMAGKVDSVRMRLEMVHCMEGLGAALGQFMTGCAEVSKAIGTAINPAELMRSQTSMETAMAQLDAFLNQTESMFDGMDVTASAPVCDPAAEAVLNGIVAEQYAEEERGRVRDEQHRILSLTGSELDNRAKRLSAN